MSILAPKLLNEVPTLAKWEEINPNLKAVVGYFCEVTVYKVNSDDTLGASCSLKELADRVHELVKPEASFFDRSVLDSKSKKNLFSERKNSFDALQKVDDLRAQAIRDSNIMTKVINLFYGLFLVLANKKFDQSIGKIHELQTEFLFFSKDPFKYVLLGEKELTDLCYSETKDGKFIQLDRKEASKVLETLDKIEKRNAEVHRSYVRSQRQRTPELEEECKTNFSSGGGYAPGAQVDDDNFLLSSQMQVLFEAGAQVDVFSQLQALCEDIGLRMEVQRELERELERELQRFELSRYSN